MILVIDANSIIAAIIKDSETRKIIVSGEFGLVSPEFLIEEIEKHKGYIVRKSGMSNDEIDLLITLLLRRIRILPYTDYENKIAEAEKIIDKDVLDVPYVAVYLALRCDGIWTNDKHYEHKDKLKIFKTDYLLKLIQK